MASDEIYHSSGSNSATLPNVTSGSSSAGSVLSTATSGGTGGYTEPAPGEPGYQSPVEREYGGPEGPALDGRNLPAEPRPLWRDERLDEARDLARDDRAIYRGSSSAAEVAMPSPQYMWAMLHECLRVCAQLMNGSLRTSPELANLYHVYRIPDLTDAVTEQVERELPKPVELSEAERQEAVAQYLARR